MRTNEVQPPNLPSTLPILSTHKHNASALSLSFSTYTKGSEGNSVTELCGTPLLDHRFYYFIFVLKLRFRP
ncbi:hypothetical protein HanIR_Chr15g0736381 [Helianthus annuus]|nr:hypothetical protein HanIR_Chr15g0736381 [Helianthus annuus]